MNNYLLPYLLLMAHFASGALWLIRINRKLEAAEGRQQWIKYFTYLILTNLLWFSILWSQLAFNFLGIFLMIVASAEWWRAVRKLKNQIWLTLFFLALIMGFWRFLYLDRALLLFTLWVVVLFDGSCQIAGQVAGRRKLLPRISPRKTVEGLFGGAVITLATALLIRPAFSFGWSDFFLCSCLLIGSAFLGDLLASMVKRKAVIETFGTILPGHGGILDRFDSLIMAGALVYLVSFIETLIR